MSRKPMARPKARRPERKPARPTKTARQNRPAKKETNRRSSAGVYHRPGPIQFFARHARLFVGSIGRLLRHPLATLMTVAVIAIALALPAALQLFVTNGRSLSGHCSFPSFRPRPSCPGAAPPPVRPPGRSPAPPRG